MRVGGRFTSFDAAGRAFRRQVPSMIRALRVDTATHVDRELDALASRSPKRTGELASGWRKVRSGDRTRYLNTVDHASIIEGGRRQGTRGVLGSLQAPRGIAGPIIEKLARNSTRFLRGLVRRRGG